MAVTAHYIDNSWTLRSHMLMFIYVPAPHSSDRLAAVLVNCMLDWNINTMLHCFSLVSDLFSGSKYPTANLFFPHICDLRIKISEWMFDPNEIIQRMAASMWAKFNKYWEVIHQILAVVVVLDPQYKLDIVEYYAEILGLDGSSLNSGRIKSILTDLVMEYHSKAIVNNAGGLGNDMPGSSSAPAHGFDLFVSQRKRSRTSSVTAVLDTYLNEDILPRTSDFDIFMWWKINGPKYPILQEIARDILAVPITSVASESSFSSRGRLLDPNRSRLHESTVEALMCTRTWLQDNADGLSDDGAGNQEGCFLFSGETSTMQTEAAIVEDNVPRNRAYNLDDID
ncbi:Putative AC transposase [Linum grandiflorum]